MRFVLRVLLLAAAFQFLLPQIGGISVHGGFGTALGLAFFFSIMGTLVSWVAGLLTAALAISTFGLALLVLVPLWLLGFWMIPAYVLMLTSDILPQYLTVSGWAPAILGGLVTLIIGIVTDASYSETRERYST